MTDTNKEWLLSFVSGQNFFDEKCKKSKVTELLYISRLKQYCDNVGKNPDQLIAIKLEGMQNLNTPKEFQAEELLRKFLSQDNYFQIDKNGKKKEVLFSENTKLGMLVTVRSFYDSTMGRSLDKKTKNFIEKPEAKKRSPSVKDCLDLENAMKCNRDKFLVWFIESCPVRKGTLRQLKFKDLKPLNDKDVPFWLRIDAKRLKGSGKGKYKKALHVGFLHYYAVQKFEEYKAELKRKGIAYDDDSALFVSYKSTPQGSRKGLAQAEFFTIFRDASEIAWKDLTKKRFSPHDLRDVISTVLRDKIKVTSNLTKPLTSHVPSGIEATYEGSDDEDTPNDDLLKVFKSCIPYLVPETIPELKIELNETKQELSQTKTDYQKTVTEQQQQIDELGKMVKTLWTKGNFALVDEEKFNEAKRLRDAKKQTGNQ
jgi:site-specific recombinase XerC